MAEDDDYQEPPPPSAGRVARRALILSAVSCRGIIEADQNPGAADLAERCLNWLKKLGLEEELTEWERSLLSSAFGSVKLKVRINAGWLSEALVVMAWALGKVDLPSFDAQCDPQDVANCLGFLQRKEETVLQNPNLLPVSSLSEYNEFIYNLHWRVRDYSIRPGPYDFESLARKAWGEPLLRHGLQIAEKDIALNGVPLSRVTESEFRLLAVSHAKGIEPRTG